MKDLAEKVEAIGKCLDEVFNMVDRIGKSVPTKPRKQGRSVRTKTLPGWAKWSEEVLRRLNELYTELGSVKEALGTGSFTDSSPPLGDGTATNAGAALVYEAPSQNRPETEQVFHAGPKSRQRAPGATDAPLAPDRDVQEFTTQVLQASLGEVTPTLMPTPSSSTKILSRGQPTEQVSHASPGNGQHVPVTINADPNVIDQELPSQARQVLTECEVTATPTPTPSTSNETSSRTTQPNAATLNPTPENGDGPTFRCNYKDISKDFNEAKFEKFSSDPRVKEMGYFKLVIEDLPPLTLDEASFSQPGKDHSTNFSCHRDSQGFVVVTKGRRREVRLPSLPFPQIQRPPSQKEQKEFWENIIKDPPLNMHYIIGDPLFPDIELSPGKGLEQMNGREIRGVGTTYAYLSHGTSLSICHGEDANFRSLNVLRAGAIKYWLLIKPAYKKELLRHMRREFPQMGHCSQALRHLSRVIPPSKLDEWGIGYSLAYQGPGEAMQTEEGTLHEVGNAPGGNYALAINISYSSSQALPQDYVFCTRSCDPHTITAADLFFREDGLLAEVQANKRKRSQPEKPDGPLTEVQANKRTRSQPEKPDGVQITRTKRKALPTQIQLRKPKVTPEMGSIFQAVCGKEAFHRLCSLIYSWRDRSKPLFDNSGRDVAVQLVYIINASEARTHLNEFLNRFAKVKLAEDIDEGKDGRMRADPMALTNLMVRLKWQQTKANRTKLNNYLKEGRGWKRISGTFEGLLCLVPPNRNDRENLQLSGHAYQALSDEDLELFHSLLESNEFIQPMCRIGKTFQASISSREEVPEFKWEREDAEKISRLSMNRLAPFMEQFHVIDKNEYCPEKYDWPKPDGWLWAWPRHPMQVSPSDCYCDLCNKNEKDCNCIVTCLPENKPRITNEGGKGQGVRVIGSTYVKGQILGELYGEVVPLDTYNDSRAIEFRRPDLDYEPVAQIYTREKGNWVGKVNHSHNPSAKFCVMKITGYWREMLVAIRDIRDNEEITANCGRSFLRGKDCLCSVCENVRPHEATS